SVPRARSAGPRLFIIPLDSFPPSSPPRLRKVLLWALVTPFPIGARILFAALARLATAAAPARCPPVVGAPLIGSGDGLPSGAGFPWEHSPFSSVFTERDRPCSATDPRSR